MDTLGIAGFVFFAIVMSIAGTIMLKSMITITRFLRLPYFTSSFILLAVGTSIPELFVGIQAGLAKASELTVGVIIGANILDMTLVTGLWLVLVRKIRVQNAEILGKDCIWMVALSATPLLLMFFFNELTRLMGALLIALFCGYAYWLVKRQPRTPADTESVGRWKIVSATLLFTLSLAGLFWSAEGVVGYATRLAMASGLPYIFIGLFLVSFGTTLPELVVQFKAGRARGGHIGLGNIIGSVITNSTLVLGVSVLLSPAAPNTFLFLTSGVFMVFIGLLFTQFVRARTMTAFQGMLLIISYVLFIVVELTVKGLIPAGT